MLIDYESYTIEPSDEEWQLIGHGVYPESSVLAGQPRRALLGFYRTVQDARDAAQRIGITAEVIEHSTRCFPLIPDVPPVGFDPLDAGERWSDDY